jgi:hypothetical protein
MKHPSVGKGSAKQYISAENSGFSELPRQNCHEKIPGCGSSFVCWGRKKP